MKIGFLANPLKPRAAEAEVSLARKARDLGLDVVPPGEACDLVIALGGDGTILHAVHQFPSVPILGFNLGGLGYLSSVGADRFDAALGKIAEGRYRLVERTMLQLDGKTALNEVVFLRETTGHAALLEVQIDGQHPTRYRTDGLVVATPTGSTAYSLSAGGPVLMPNCENLVITPMNPHALGVRPIVVRDSVVIRVSSCRRDGASAEKIAISLDGEVVSVLNVGGSVELTKAPRPARLVELEGYDPYEVMSRKLGWSGVI